MAGFPAPVRSPHPLPHIQLLSSLESLEEEADIARVSKIALEKEKLDLRSRCQQLENQMRAVTAEFKQVRRCAFWKGEGRGGLPKHHPRTPTPHKPQTHSASPSSTPRTSRSGC